MNLRSYLILGPLSGLLGLVSSSCALPLVLNPVQWSDTADGQTLFLLTYSLQAAAVDLPQNCVLRLRRQRDQKLYEIMLATDTRQTLIEATPDHYRLEQVHCKDLETWTLDSAQQRLAWAKPGQINYLGHLVFRFGTESTLKNIEAERNEKAAALRSMFTLMPARYRDRVLNAYTGSFIPQAAAQRKGQQREVKLTIRKGEKVSPAELNQKLDDCEQKEKQANPTAIGTLSYELRYEKRKLQDLKRTAATHTFTPTFVSCAEEAMREFRPTSEHPVEIQLSL